MPPKDPTKGKNKKTAAQSTRTRQTKRHRTDGGSASQPTPSTQEAPTVISTEGYSPFLDGDELPPKWNQYHFLPLVPETYFYIKDIMDKSEYGSVQLKDAAKIFKSKELLAYSKPRHVIYPYLTKLFYSTMRYEDPNIHVKIGGKEFIIFEDDVVKAFKHSDAFIEDAGRFIRPSCDAGKYPPVADMTRELFMLEHTNKRHHLKTHTHILLHRLIQSNILPSLGSKDVLSRDVFTLIYGIMTKTIMPAQSIFYRWIVMTRTHVFSLPYPSFITAILTQKGYKIPETSTKGFDPKMFKVGDWSRSFNNSFNERAKAFRTQNMPLTKGLVMNGEVLEVQPLDTQASSSGGPSNVVIYAAINSLKGLVIGNQKEMRSRCDIIEKKIEVQDARFDSLEVNMKLLQSGFRAMCEEGCVHDDDLTIPEFDEDVLDETEQQQGGVLQGDGQ